MFAFLVCVCPLLWFKVGLACADDVVVGAVVVGLFLFLMLFCGVGVLLLLCCWLC